MKDIVACNVLRLRKANHWTQTELARKSGLAQRTVSAIERREIAPTVESVEQLAGAFKLPAWGLLVAHIDPALFSGDGLGKLVAVYADLPADSRRQLDRIAELESRYSTDH